MDGGGYRIEAQRWLSIAEKLLATRDLAGAKSFAVRARESDPRLQEFSDQIIAVSETLTASELRVNGNSYDYYSILQLAGLTRSIDLVATQYRKLALLLNPSRNQLPFAEQAFQLVSEAWLLFSNPSKKAMYDHEMEMMGQFFNLGQINHSHPQQFGQPGTEVLGFHPLSSEGGQSPGRKSPRGWGNVAAVVGEASRPIWPMSQWKTPLPKPVPESIRQQQPLSNQHFTVSSSNSGFSFNAASGQFPKPMEHTRSATSARPVQTTGDGETDLVESDVLRFWTMCPYCFLIYEYPKVYEDCALRCQNCKRAFQAVEVPSPPVAGKDGYFCCWAYFPLGGRGGGGRRSSGWSPFSAMFATPLQNGDKPATKVVNKDDLFMDMSEYNGDDDDDDEDDWRSKTKMARGGWSGRGSHTRNVGGVQSDRGSNVSNLDGEAGRQVAAEMAMAKSGEGIGSEKRKAAKDLGKLDLNVMFSNEVEEAIPGLNGGNNRTGDGGGGEDNIEGIVFFEDLDEFFSSFPILSAVGDDKVTGFSVPSKDKKAKALYSRESTPKMKPFYV